MPFEGSSDVDTGSVPAASTDSTVEELTETEEVETSPKDTGEEETVEEKVEYTSKGTKLDPNPQSRAYQELANERRLRTQYEQVLSNPEALKRYASEMGLTLSEARAEIKEEQKKLYTPDRFKTADDVANALNEIYETHQKSLAELKEENRKLREGLTNFSHINRNQQMVTTLKNDIATITSTYPELNPKSPEYDPELEKEIGQLYNELDFDERSGTYRGQFSLAKITERVMRAAGRGKKKGAQEAQTTVKVKQAGKIVTSTKNTKREASESTDPSTVIAERIAKAFGN